MRPMRSLAAALAATLAAACSSPPPPPPPPPAPVLATVEVHNTSDECATPVPIRVLIDRELRGEVQPGDVLRVQLEVGAHELRFADAVAETPTEILRDEITLGEAGVSTYFGCSDPAFRAPREGWVEVSLKNHFHGCQVGTHGHVVWRLNGRHVAGLPAGGEATRWLPPGVHTLSEAFPGRRLEKTRVEVAGGFTLTAGCDGQPRADGRLLPLTVAHPSGMPIGCRAPIKAYVAGQELELSVGEAWTALLPTGVHHIRFTSLDGGELGEPLAAQLETSGAWAAATRCQGEIERLLQPTP